MRTNVLVENLVDNWVLVIFYFAGILETYWDKHSVIASTPPPSPTSGQSGESIVHYEDT